MSRRHKYGASKTVVDGITFASKKEARRYGELRMLERSGEIRGLEIQPAFLIEINGEPVRAPADKRGRRGAAYRYYADFAYVDKDGRYRVEDTKGADLPLSRLKRALVHAIHGVTVEVI